MDASFLLAIVGGLAILLLVISLFVRSAGSLKVASLLQVLLFVSTGAISLLSLSGQHFALPDILIFTPIRMYFFLILSVVGVGISIYGMYYLQEYLNHHKHIGIYIFLTLLFVYSMVGIVLCNEMISFLVLWEIMSLASYFLVVHEPQKEGVISDGARYFIITHIGFFAILFAFLPFVSASGSTFFDTRSAVHFSPMTKNLIFLLALFGFGSKAGLFPMHIRLPKAHPIAPSHISALMSGCMVKIPVLFLFIFIQQFFGSSIPLWRGVVVLALGAVSAFIGIFYASIQSNIKKMLAYSTIENIGIIFVGLGLYMIGTTLQQPALILIGIFASLYHSFNHAVFKSLLFCSAGSILERTGVSDIRKLGGLIKKLPVLGGVFLLGSWAIIGLPPLNGFNSEILTILGLLQGFQLEQGVAMMVLFAVVLVMIAMMSAVAITCFSKAFSVMFLGYPREDTVKVDIHFSRSEIIAFVWMILLILGLTIFPGYILSIIYSILGQATTVSPFVLPLGSTQYIPVLLLVILIVGGGLGYFRYQRVIKNSVVKTPWNCGYPYIVPRTQYSGNSFIQPLRRIFASFFGEEKTLSQITSSSQDKRFFKKEIVSLQYTVSHSYRFDLFFEGITRRITRISDQVKLLMNGNLNLYIAYICISLLVATVLFYFSL